MKDHIEKFTKANREKNAFEQQLKTMRSHVERRENYGNYTARTATSRYDHSANPTPTSARTKYSSTTTPRKPMRPSSAPTNRQSKLSRPGSATSYITSARSRPLTARPARPTAALDLRIDLGRKEIEPREAFFITQQDR